MPAAIPRKVGLAVHGVGDTQLPIPAFDISLTYVAPFPRHLAGVLGDIGRASAARRGRRPDHAWGWLLPAHRPMVADVRPWRKPPRMRREDARARHRAIAIMPQEDCPMSADLGDGRRIKGQGSDPSVSALAAAGRDPTDITLPTAGPGTRTHGDGCPGPRRAPGHPGRFDAGFPWSTPRPSTVADPTERGRRRPGQAESAPSDCTRPSRSLRSQNLEFRRKRSNHSATRGV